MTVSRQSVRRQRDTRAVSEAEVLARRFGLTKAGDEVPLVPYIRQLWRRRHFIDAFARSRIQAENARNRLGDI